MVPYVRLSFAGEVPALKIKLENTLYFRKTPAGDLCFVLICQADNYVYAGETKQIREFEKFLQSEFDVGELRNSVSTVTIQSQ